MYNRYIFKTARNLNEELNYGLGYSQNSNFTTNFFAGPSWNSYKINIYVQVYDNNGAFTVYDILTPVQVVPDLTNLETTMEKLISSDPTFSTNIILNQGSYLKSIQILQTISSLLNAQSYSDKLGLMLNKSKIAFPQIYGPMANYSGSNAVNKF